MLDAYIIRPSISPFASAITITPKGDRTFSLCADYRALNHQTEVIPFLLPKIPLLTKQVDVTGFLISTFARVSGKYCCMRTQSTLLLLPFDLFEYNRLPFGRKNSPAWFQKITNYILKQYLKIFCNVCRMTL